MTVPQTAAQAAKPAISKQRYMVCTHGNVKLLKSAIVLAKNSHSELLVLFVRHLAVHPMGPLGPNRGEDDAEALALFNAARQLAAEEEVQVYCLYALSNDIADTILEMAVTHGVSQLVMGTSQRGGTVARDEGRCHRYRGAILARIDLVDDSRLVPTSPP